MNIINAVKNNYGKYLARTAGAVAVGLIARDAHIIGKLQADVTSSTHDANLCTDLYENSTKNNNASTLKSETKDKVFKLGLENNTLSFFTAGWGYVKGFVNSLISHVAPLALGATALLAKNKKIACGSAIGLGIYTTISFFKDGLGIGSPKYLRK